MILLLARFFLFGFCMSIKINAYNPLSKIKQIHLLVISGPSGVGKSTLLGKLFKEFPHKFGFSVSHNTRVPRPGEINGDHYSFIDKKTMQKMIDNEEFLEWATYLDHLCGTSKAAVEKVCNSGKICVLDIDNQGVCQMKAKSHFNATYIFIKPPSMKILESRLRNRNTESEQNIKKRMNLAKEELGSLASKKDIYDVIIENDNLERAYNEFRQFLLHNYKHILEQGAITNAVNTNIDIVQYNEN